MSKKRQVGFYWVALVHRPGVPTIARWNGAGWVLMPGTWASSTPRVRRVLSGPLAAPGVDFPLPLQRVLLDEPPYMTLLRVLHVNHATGSVYVSKR